MKRRNIIMMVISLMILLNIGFIFLSSYLFLNQNIYRSVFALMQVKADNEKIVKIADTPDVYMTDKNNDTDEFFRHMQYEEIEEKRLGSKRFVLKDGKEYSVLVHTTKAYTVFYVEKI